MATILAIDDSPTVLSALDLLLRREGHNVCTAKDGLSAFAMLHKVSPDLILLDIGLPVVGGIELCVAIRQTPNFRATPIVMLTGSHKHVDIKLAHEFGANAYITKPFEEAALISVINGLLAEANTPMASPHSQEAA